VVPVSDPYYDCPACDRTRLNNPCEHCGDLYTPKEIPKDSVDIAHR
jgi:methionyl-tRNA synthetase